MYIIKNAKLLLPDRVAEAHHVWIKDDRIEKITSGQTPLSDYYTIIDGQGGYLSPGFIDIHSDYIEHVTAPRPTALMDFDLSLREAERELLVHGVTTIYHSLSFYKEEAAYSKPIRKQENVKQLINKIQDTHTARHLIRHRFHARLELEFLEGADHVRDYIDSNQIDLLSFMDHTPGQGQFSDIDKYKEISKGYSQDLTDEEIEKKIKIRQALPKLSQEDINELTDYALKRNIAVASHDDDSIEKIDEIKKMGISISEFPITLEVAKYAHKLGLKTVAGAPNVVLGGSHSGNLAAHEAISNKVIDILCSDYYPAALLHSVFKLHRDYGHPLHEMMNLITINPAKAVNICGDYGSIEVGKKADLVLIQTIENDFPVITSCFVDGKHAFQANYRV